MRLVPPPGVADPDLWLFGWARRVVHRPVPGDATCPACRQPWPCPDYQGALADMDRATMPPSERRRTGVGRVILSAYRP